jgi:hypothetical protein
MCLRAHNPEVYVTVKIYFIEKISIVVINMDKGFVVFSSLFEKITRVTPDASS